MEHACIREGIRLRDAERGLIRWRDVFIVARFAPEGSPLAIAIDPEARTWDAVPALLAVIVDQFNLIRWELGGGKGERPKPIPRPWKVEGDGKTFAGELMMSDEFDDWMAGYFADESSDGSLASGVAVDEAATFRPLDDRE